MFTTFDAIDPKTFFFIVLICPIAINIFLGIKLYRKFGEYRTLAIASLTSATFVTVVFFISTFQWTMSLQSGGLALLISLLSHALTNLEFFLWNHTDRFNKRVFKLLVLLITIQIITQLCFNRI